MISGTILVPTNSPTQLVHDFTVTPVTKKGPRGIQLLKAYENSFLNMVTSIYPDHIWKPWKFSDKLSPNFWVNTDNQRAFLDHCAEKLGIRTYDEW